MRRGRRWTAVGSGEKSEEVMSSSSIAVEEGRGPRQVSEGLLGLKRDDVLS